jgi:hypothetical protein
VDEAEQSKQNDLDNNGEVAICLGCITGFSVSRNNPGHVTFRFEYNGVFRGYSRGMAPGGHFWRVTF